MPSRNAHRQLLLGLLALQNGFVNQAQLVAAFGVWSLDKSRLLDEILAEQKALDPSARSLLSALVERHLANHQQDAEQSLAALPAQEGIRSRLNSIADPDLGASLIRLKGNETKANEPDVTQALPVTHAGGRFVVLRPHARGGLGKVSVALDSELNRQVALKEIREEYAHDEYSQSRFMQEAEITGQLEHPGIVPVYGLGAYRDGRPYYAMRFVEGQSLKAAIESFHAQRTTTKLLTSEQTVSFRNLIGRFVAACHAIEYAHSRKVIHRDLKPDNIMLGPYGETLVVDWGLAKSLDADSKTSTQAPSLPLQADETLARARPVKLKGNSGATPTLEGSALGTPAYMSPEQAHGKLAELGPASDVYSLGATLYVLLSGQAAFQGEDVTDLLDKVRRGQFVAPRAVWSGVPRALEAICLKAMATKSADRYPSAHALAQDLERYLADEPVSARPDPFLVRCRRWMKRHPALVASAAATVILGLTGTLTLAAVSRQHASALEGKNQTISGQLAELQQRNATISQQKTDLQSQNEALQTAQKQEKQAKERAENVTKYLVNMFRSANPEVSGKDVKVVEVLDRQAAYLAAGFEADPVNRAAMLSAIGESYLGLGNAQKAASLFQITVALRRANLGPSAPETIEAATMLAKAQHHAGRSQEAAVLLEESTALAAKSLGPERNETLNGQSRLVEVYLALGQFQKAAALAAEVLEKRRSLTPHSDTTLFAMNDVALTLRSLSRPKEAIPKFEEVLELLKKRFGQNHVETLICAANLADAYRDAGEDEKANQTLLRVIEGRTQVLGATHPQVQFARNNLALGLQNLKRFSEAAEILEDVEQTLAKQLSNDHPQTLMAKINLAYVYLDMREFDKATTRLTEAFEMTKADPQRLTDQMVYSARALASAYARQSRHQKAVEVLRAADASLSSITNPPPTFVLQVRRDLGKHLREIGELDEAIAVCSEVRTKSAELLGADTMPTLYAGGFLATSYLYAGRLDEAIAGYEEIIPPLEKLLGADNIDTLSTKYDLATAYLEAGEFSKAKNLSERIRNANKKLKENDSALYAATLSLHAQILMAEKQFDEAAKLLETAIVLQDKVGATPHDAQFDRALLGCAHVGKGDFDQAQAILMPAVEKLLASIDQLPQGSGPKMLRIIENVIALSRAQQKADEAEQWRQKRDELKTRYSTGKRR